jgi:hypothetical protein
MGLGDRLFGSARDRFGREVAARIRQIDSVTESVYEAREFRVAFRRSGDSQRGYAYLENAFRECQGVSAEERESRMTRLVSIAAAAPVSDDWETVRPPLRPVLRSAVFGIDQGPVKAPLNRPALPYLAEFVVIDTATAMGYVNTGHATRWGVDVEEVFAAARSNMADIALSSLDRKRTGAGPVRFVDDGDSYFASLLLMDGWLAGMGVRLGAPPLAFVPSQSNGLEVLGVGGPIELNALLKVAVDEYQEAVRPISPVPYTVNEDGDVVPYEVPRDHPSWQAIRHAQVVLAANTYTPQTGYLKALYEREEVDVFISTLQCFRTPGGTDITVATWSDDLVSLLPEAHYVAFPGQEEGSTFLVPWAVVAAEAGLVPEEGFSPPRYRVGDWPDAATMARFRAQAEQP